MDENISFGAHLACTVATSATLVESLRAPELTYDIVCYDADGNEKWREVIHNTVMTGGKTDLLDKYFKGSNYSAAWYCGLISSVSYTGINVADTMSSHSGWTEAGPTNVPNYSQSTRVAVTWGTASAGSLAASAACAFSITSTGTVKGAFITTGSAKDGTTGVLYSASTFSADRSVANGDTINVTPTMTAT